MKRSIAFWIALVCAFALAPDVVTGQAVSQAPHLRKQGTATQLIVDGKPFLLMSGELLNNSATSLEHMKPIWPKLVAGNMNSVLAAVSWAQVEPEEGRFDFTVVDGLIREARNHNLRLVFLWFGSWKNGMSSYMPEWVKRDFRKYPRAKTGQGRTLELLSPVDHASRDANARAFRALMKHIREVDSAHRTVIMMQVENEVGMLRDSRDRSELANKAFHSQVPKELMDYLVTHKATLAPELAQAWRAAGNRTSGTWEQVFGPGKPDSIVIPIQTLSPPFPKEEIEAGWKKMHWPADEIFMAWHYARYIGKIAEEGKAEYNIPMFVNAWLQQPNMFWPGTYPSGGPLPQVADIWRAGAPAIDFQSPDIYLPQFEEIAERFMRNGNPLFIPETFGTGRGPVNALIAFGKYNAIGFSPFGIDRSVGPNTELAASYRILNGLAPLIAKHQGKGTMTTVVMEQGDGLRKVKLGDYTLELTYFGRGRVPIAPEPPRPVQQTTTPALPFGQAPQPPMIAAAILIAAGPDEFYFGGGGMRIDFTPNTPGSKTVGLALVQEGRFVDGKWVPGRWLGGDDIGQGEFLPLRPNTILRVKVYRYE